MNVKTITASSIHAALIQARSELGDDVVLLESIPPSGDEPARITVMGDMPFQAPEPRKKANAKQAEPFSVGHTAKKKASKYGYGAGNQLPAVAVLQEETARRHEGFSRSSAHLPFDYTEKEPADESSYEFSVGARSLLSERDESTRRSSMPASPSEGNGETRKPGRGFLFPSQKSLVPLKEEPAQYPSIERFEKILSIQLQSLTDRLDNIERRFEGAIIGAAQRWTAHPLFANLLSKGMRPGSITKLFDALAGRGYSPDADEETLKWALAQELRNSLNLVTPKRTNGAHVFIGPSGAGKTSLLLKLAAHPGFFGRHRTAVIIILPPDEDAGFYQNPIEVFRGFGLPVQTVSSVEDMSRAISRVQHFDQILIDTPPLPMQDVRARKLLAHIKRLVDPIMPLHVQLVFNATRSLEDFDPSYVHRLPLRPDVVSLTHLDETAGWGRIAEWLMALRLPVQFASTSANVPDGVLAFSTTWFVEEMMKL